MSYGRDKNLLVGVGTYRQAGPPNMAQASAGYTNRPRRKPGSGGGGNLWWKVFEDVFKPSKIMADRVRLLRGEYPVEYVVYDSDGNAFFDEESKMPILEKSVQPVYPVTEHYYNRTKRTAICSAGPYSNFRKWRGACLGCDEFWAEMQERKEQGEKRRIPMGRNAVTVASVLHYAPYHNVPKVDYKSGAPILNQKTGKPYMHWVVCQEIYERPCQACRDKAEKKQGHVGHWKLGSGHWQVLLKSQEAIGRSCVACGGVKCVQSLYWICSSCSYPVVDLSTMEYTPEEFHKMITEVVRCPECSQHTRLSEMIKCINCAPRGFLPQRATLFDVDLDVMRVESASSETTVLQLSNWSEPHPLVEPWVSMAVPLDLPSIYCPTPLAVQAQLFQLPLPLDKPQASVPTPETAARPYGEDMYKP